MSASFSVMIQSYLNRAILIFLFLCLTNLSLGQNLPGTWQAGWAIDVADSQVVTIAISGDEVYLTENSGTDWRLIADQNDIYGSVIDLSITSAKNIWLATGAGSIYASDNGGDSWQVQFQNDTLVYFMNYIEMFDSLNGVAMGDAVSDTLPAVFLKTIDGGQNWQQLNTPCFGPYSGDTWRRLDFVSTDIGYFFESGVNPQKLYKTIDGGANWQITNYSEYAQVLKFYDENYGLAIAGSAQINRTLDGGETWETFDTGHTGWGNDIEFDPYNPARVWFTDHTSMYASYDSGKTWRQFDWKIDDLKARDIAFSQSGEAWVLGDDGILLNKAYKKSANTASHNGFDYDYITTSQTLMWFSNNGDGSHDPITDGNGFYWPGGINATQNAIFEDGLCWGGIVGDSVRVNGNTHRQGIQPGNILTTSTAADPTNDRFNIWRANDKWPIISDISVKRMEYDWNNWPTDLGAPFIDNNGDGRYDPSADNAVAFGDEMYWMVMNDMDTTISRFTYGADPIGLEIQLSVYAYDRDVLEDVIFKKYKMLNKGENNVDSMYLSYWSDPDLGDAGDDFVGFDTLLNLAYCYNDGDDDVIYGTPVPAVGYLLLQGAVVSATQQDSAFANGEWIPGYRNEKMTTSVLYIGGDATYSDPNQGIIEGSYEFYNYMTGKLWNGLSFLDPVTGLESQFVVPGDPVSGTGWYEGDGWSGGPISGDRRLVMSSGPFDFAQGDSQEVVYAILIARGDNYLDSVTKLKEKALAVKEFYYTGKLPTAIDDQKLSALPLKFSLSQNYPNPFNPTTVIDYDLPNISNVKLIIYDVLGREVKTLVNKTQQAGIHQVTFNASGLASGVYYYKIKAGTNYEQTRKMLLLR